MRSFAFVLQCKQAEGAAVGALLQAARQLSASYGRQEGQLALLLRPLPIQSAATAVLVQLQLPTHHKQVASSLQLIVTAPAPAVQAETMLKHVVCLSVMAAVQSLQQPALAVTAAARLSGRSEPCLLILSANTLEAAATARSIPAQCMGLIAS
jgi:hypothetical protein